MIRHYGTSGNVSPLTLTVNRRHSGSEEGGCVLAKLPGHLDVHFQRTHPMGKGAASSRYVLGACNLQLNTWD
ncbi:hypothetical protein M404DRAFT_996256 [Pisolithus tinctorius Marx 270]|uniref:Uncharacterized protein n=1 Tax=Pisolithus tinctorius Marx 270 TaxID=870435 RepID=A0A0C3P7N0_PISTI|nr:hypothetical protein M404DRAFT_996256 [Pisolithus tinctorius Marx 270]